MHVWLTEGATVAVLTGLWHDRAHLATVSRIEERWVWLDDGTRYDRHTLRERGNHWGDRIMSPDAPRAKRVLEASR